MRGPVIAPDQPDLVLLALPPLLRRSIEEYLERWDLILQPLHTPWKAYPHTPPVFAVFRKGDPLTPPVQWTGKLAAALRAAYGDGITPFSDRVGLTRQAVGKWEVPKESTRRLSVNTRAALDLALTMAPDEIKARFVQLATDGEASPAA